MNCLVLPAVEAAQLYDKVYRLLEQQVAGQRRLAVLCFLRDLFRRFDPKQDGFVTPQQFEFLLQYHFPPAVHSILGQQLMEQIVAGISRESQGHLQIRYDLFCHAICYRNSATAEALTVLREHARSQVRLGKVFRNNIFEPETTYDAFFFQKTRQLFLSESKKTNPVVTNKMKFRALLRVLKLGLFPKPAQRSVLELISVGESSGTVLGTLQVLMDHVDDLFLTVAAPIADVSISAGEEDELTLARRNFHRVPVDLNRKNALGAPSCVYLWVKRHGVGCTNQFSVVDLVCGAPTPAAHEDYARVTAATETPKGAAAAAVLGLWVRKLPGVHLSTVLDLTVKCSDAGIQPVFLAPPESWTQHFQAYGVRCCLVDTRRKRRDAAKSDSGSSSDSDGSSGGGSSSSSDTDTSGSSGDGAILNGEASSVSDSSSSSASSPKVQNKKDRKSESSTKTKRKTKAEDSDSDNSSDSDSGSSSSSSSSEDESASKQKSSKRANPAKKLASLFDSAAAKDARATQKKRSLRDLIKGNIHKIAKPGMERKQRNNAKAASKATKRDAKVIAGRASFLPQRCRALFVATGRSQKGSSRKRRTSMFSPTGPISSSEDEDSLGDPLDGVVPRRGFFCELLLRRREDPHRISILSQILGLVSELHPSESAMKKISTQGIVGLPARVAAFQRLFRTKRGGDDVIDFREGIGQIKRHGALLEYKDADIVAACTLLSPKGFSCAFLGSLFGLGLPTCTPERVQCLLFRITQVSSDHTETVRVLQQLQSVCHRLYEKGGGDRRTAWSWNHLFESVTRRRMTKRPGATVPRLKLLDRLQGADADLERLLAPLPKIQSALVTNALVGTTFKQALNTATENADTRAASMRHSATADIELDFAFFTSVLGEPFSLEIEDSRFQGRGGSDSEASAAFPPLGSSSNSSSSSSDSDSSPDAFRPHTRIEDPFTTSLIKMRRTASPFPTNREFGESSAVRGRLEITILSAQGLSFPRSFKPPSSFQDGHEVPVFVRAWVEPFMRREDALVTQHAANGSLRAPIWIHQSSYTDRRATTQRNLLMEVQAHFRPPRTHKEAQRQRDSSITLSALRTSRSSRRRKSLRKSKGSSVKYRNSTRKQPKYQRRKRGDSSSSSDSSSTDDDDDALQPILRVEVWAGEDRAHLQRRQQSKDAGISKLQGIIDFAPFFDDNIQTPAATLLGTCSAIISSEMAASAFVKTPDGDSTALSWCSKPVSAILELPLQSNLPSVSPPKSSRRNSSSRREKGPATTSSELQVALKWTPGGNPADADKFVGWLRVALMQIDGVSPTLTMLQKAVRLRPSGLGVRTLDSCQGRIRSGSSVATAGAGVGRRPSLAATLRGAAANSFFAVPHAEAAVPQALPEHLSSTSMAWPAGDAAIVQFLVMNDGPKNPEGDTTLVVEMWGRRTAGLHQSHGAFGQSVLKRPEFDPMSTGIAVPVENVGDANVLLGLGRLDIEQILRPMQQPNSSRLNGSTAGSGKNVFQVQLQSLDGTGSCTCHVGVVFEPAGPEDMALALRTASVRPGTPARAKLTSNDGRAQRPASGVSGGPFGIFNKLSPSRLAALRQGTPKGAAAVDGSHFSLAHMRARLSNVDPASCLKFCLEVDKKNTGHIGACDFEVVLQRCGVALHNGELAALYHRLDYSKTGCVDYQFFGALMLGREFTEGVARTQATPHHPRDKEVISNLLRRLLQHLERRAHKRMTAAARSLGGTRTAPGAPTLEQSQIDVEAEVQNIFATYDRTGSGIMSERVFNNCLSMVFGEAIRPDDVTLLLSTYRSSEDPGCAAYPRFLQHLFSGAADDGVQLDMDDPDTMVPSDEHDALQRIRYWLWDVSQEGGINTGAIGSSSKLRRGGPQHSYAGGVAEARSLEMVRLKRQQPARLPQLRDSFQHADTNNTGRLTRVAFRRALSAAGAPVADKAWPLLLDAAVARSAEQQQGRLREQQRQVEREFGHMQQQLLASQPQRRASQLAGGSQGQRQNFDGYIDYELFIRTLLAGDRGQGRSGGRSMTMIRTRILNAVYVRLRNLVGNGRHGIEHLFCSFDVGARAAIPDGEGRARFISKGDFAEALDLLVHRPNLEIHERRQVVDAFADIVDPRWINVDSFIESFATVNTFDVDEIFVRAATERQSRVLQLSRQLQAGTRTPFGRDHRRGGSAQQPYLEEPLWLSYADIAAVFEEAGVDPYNTGCISEFQFRGILEAKGTGTRVAGVAPVGLNLGLQPWEMGAVCEYFSISQAHRTSQGAKNGFGGAGSVGNGGGAARDIYYNEFAKAFAAATGHLVRNLPGNRGPSNGRFRNGVETSASLSDAFRGKRRDLRVDTSPKRDGPPRTLGNVAEDMSRQRQSWDATGMYGHQTDERGLADHDVARNRTLGDVQFDRDLMHRIQGAQPHPHRLQQRFQREQRHHHHPNLYDPYGRGEGAVQRMPATGRPRLAQHQGGRPVMEVSEPLHHNDLAYRSEQDVIEAKMERLQQRHRRGDGNYPAERTRMTNDGRVPEAKVVVLSSGRRHAGSQSARSSNRGRVLARPKTSRHSSTGQRRHRHQSRR